MLERACYSAYDFRYIDEPAYISLPLQLRSGIKYSSSVHLLIHKRAIRQIQSRVPSHQAIKPSFSEVLGTVQNRVFHPCQPPHAPLNNFFSIFLHTPQPTTPHRDNHPANPTLLSGFAAVDGSAAEMRRLKGGKNPRDWNRSESLINAVQ